MFWWALLILLLPSERNLSFGCLEAEKMALLELKAALNYPNGSALHTWDGQQSDCCSWERVICDNGVTTKRKRVTQLILNNTRDYELTNPYWLLNASYLLPFKKLQVLDLSWTYLKGTEFSLFLCLILVFAYYSMSWTLAGRGI